MTLTRAQHQYGHKSVNSIEFLASLQKQLQKQTLDAGYDYMGQTASFPLFYPLTGLLEWREPSSFSCLPCAGLSVYVRPLHHLEGPRGNEEPALPLPATPKGHGQQSGILLPVKMQNVVIVTHEGIWQTHCSLHKETEPTSGVINHQYWHIIFH